MLLKRRTIFTTACVLIFIVYNLFYFASFKLNNFVTIEEMNISYSDRKALIKHTKPTVLLWTNFFKNRTFAAESNCPLADRCTFTTDRERLLDADAIVFIALHINLYDMPSTTKLQPSALRVLWMSEAYENALNHHHLSELPVDYFHWMVTFFNESPIRRIFGGPWMSRAEAITRGVASIKLPYDPSTILRDKERPIVWAVSNCRTVSGREMAVLELKKHIEIDVIGRCSLNFTGKILNNNCSTRDEERGTCDLLKKYYFMIVAENTICDEYITEKYWNRYAQPIVPIVMRRRIYENRLPPHSFIAMDDYSSPKQMAQHLNFLITRARNDGGNGSVSDYMEYFNYRRQEWTVPQLQSVGYRSGFCKICEQLMQRKVMGVTLPPPRIFNVTEWHRVHARCERDEFARQWISANNDTLTIDI